MWLLSVILFIGVSSLELPENCSSDQYYDPGSLSCQFCPVNASMVRFADGFSCTCADHSIPSGPGHCRPCNVTELVSADGTACVPRKCQNVSGRVACRKCPNDYISVTQNLDGSPMREVQCIKCARGYKPQGGTCTRCESCTCSKNQVIVRGICVPKVYVNGRPTYEEKLLHPLELLDVVKHEYLCTKNKSRMCRTLANECVKNFYTSDLGGPCRLWIQPKLAPIGRPPLELRDKTPGEISVPRGKGVITLGVIIYTSNGGMKFLDVPDKNTKLCQLPLEIKLGNDFLIECNLNITKLSSSDLNETLSPYVLTDGEYKPLSVSIKKPSGYNVQKGSWPSSRFNRYFIVHHSLSTTTNFTNTVYLRTLLIRLRIDRDINANGSLRLQISMEAQYASAGRQDSAPTTLKVEHVMPAAGVVRGLEVWGGALGAVLAVFVLVQWRGTLRRGGPHYSVVPLLAGAAADTLYFAALVATLHALAAEAGTLGMTLPLSQAEEKIIKDFLLSAVSLKILKVAWIIWKQCTCDIFFLNWAEYNPPVVKDIFMPLNESWKATTLAREWSQMQTTRKASLGFTVTGALFLLHLMAPWQSYIPESQGYKWAVASIAWWASYGIVLLTSAAADRLLVSPTSDLPKICNRLGLSLLVFQEEYYAHYVHGRNDDFKEVRSMAGPLAKCRVACVPQLRAVSRQLSTPTEILADTESRQALLSKFLAAFFERALDGLNWVASERTVLERLLDVELTARESGGTSALLYDEGATPSCFIMTWWGEEWHLCTFDAMLFSGVLITSGNALLAAFVTISVWQALKKIRTWLGNKNQVYKTGVDIHIF